MENPMAKYSYLTNPQPHFESFMTSFKKACTNLEISQGLWYPPNVYVICESQLKRSSSVFLQTIVDMLDMFYGGYVGLLIRQSKKKET